MSRNWLSRSSIVARSLGRLEAYVSAARDTKHRPRGRRAGEDPAPFIVGSPRSGTTLLRLMLDSHPLVAIPPETGFLPRAIRSTHGSNERRRRHFEETLVNYPAAAPGWADFGISPDALASALQSSERFRVDDALRSFYRIYAARFGKSRWGDKTPGYGRSMRLIRRTLPEARFIHVIRDGRDAALSLRHLWFSPGTDLKTLAWHWRGNVEAIRREAAGCLYLEVRYEDLILDTASTLKRICAFLDLDYDSGMLGYHHRAAVRLGEHHGRETPAGVTLLTRSQRIGQQWRVTTPPDASRVFLWKTAMCDSERAGFEAVAGKLLQALGYPGVG
jgi:hypothetical protein